MKRKKWLRKAVSGVLTAVTLLSSLAPLPAMAAEFSPEDDLGVYVEALPDMEAVADQLDSSERVAAGTYEVEAGAEIDLNTDFSGISYDKEKVRVGFYKAQNKDGQAFSSSRPDTYLGIYYAEPVSGHPAYRFTRTIIVKEPAVETQNENGNAGEQANASETESEDADADPDSQISIATLTTGKGDPLIADAASDGVVIEDGEDAVSQNPEGAAVLGEAELDAALEQAEKQETYDWESGLTLSGVLIWATEEEGLDLGDMEAGDTVSFKMPSLKAAVKAATGTQTVTITKGDLYYYADYGYGSYVTSPYYVSFGNVNATAFCVQPALPGPGTGVYTISKVSGNKNLAKVLYYSSSDSGSKNYFSNYHTDFSYGAKLIITHLAASYANGSSDAFVGANDTAQALAMDLYNYCVNLQEIPSAAMSFSDSHVTSYKDGDGQRTKEVTFNADSQQSVTLSLPDGVVFHNVTTGKDSAAGAKVTISGGTTFYLSAPLTQTSDVSGSWSATVKGSISKDYTAYKITTGEAEQDLAFVFGEGTESSGSASFSVEWLALANINITKTDSVSGKNLAGAVFGVYADEACTNLITKMPATDNNGTSTVEIVVTQNTVYLKEITPPKGYVFRVSAHNVKVVAGNDSNLSITNQEIMGQITIYKEGEVLTGVQEASVLEDIPMLKSIQSKNVAGGLVFQYETVRLADAIFQVTAGEDIISADGTLIYQKGDVVADKLSTGSDGSVTLGNLHLGTYVITETGAPQGFFNEGESKMITLTETDPSQEIVSVNTTFYDCRQAVSVLVNKVDDTTKQPLWGAVFGLYAGEDIKDIYGNAIVPKDALVDKATSNINGEAAFDVDLPLNYSYYVKELEAPDNYVRNETDVFSFTASYSDDTEPVIEFAHTFENERVSARIDLVKMDAETGAKTQGDASFAGATYGLYARVNIVHPDGKSGVVYPTGYQVATLTTDCDGKAYVEDLYLGLYYIKELVPPEGYLLDTTEYDVDCYFEGDLSPIVKRSVTSLEQVIRQPFQIIKAANNGKTDADLLSGVGFSAYLVSSLPVNADGSYDFTGAVPVVIAEDNKTEMFTDNRGYAQSIALPYGEYIVRETTTPHNFTPVDDFIVKITENHPDTPQVWRVLLDEEFEAKLKIVKKDDETKKAILLANTEFKIYDMDHDQYVEQVTTYPETTVHKSYFTDANGYLILPNSLHPGRYRIEEVTAPEGYTVNTDGVEVLVDSNTAYQMDTVSGDAVITVEVENRPVKGKLTVIKKGEVLKGFGKDFIYEEAALSGAEFAVYAAEDIYTPDHQTDADGNRVVLYAKDAQVTTIVTGENGKAAAENLPLGAYYVKETNAPYGFVLNTQPHAVAFTYVDQNTPVVEQALTFTNDRQKVSISVEKQDAQTGSKVAGATFALYAREDIIAGEKVLVKADTLLAEAVSDEAGIVCFTLDLPFGLYYVKESKAPAGFVSSDEVLEYDAAYKGQDIPVVQLTAAMKNEPTTFETTKSDVTTGVELDGATLTVLDKKGNVIDTWTSVKDKPHVIQYLTVGESYILREEFAPYGYLKTSEVSFTVEDTAQVQKVEMKDEVPTALLIVNKKGEFLDKVTLLDNAKGVVEHFFEYITGNLTEVTFEVYAAEDIHAADGVSEDRYKKDELIGTITTDENGIAKLGDLPVGKYYVKEVSTAHGYVLDGEPRYIDLTYRDQDTPVVVYDENWQNSRQKVSVHVLKVEKDTQKPLQGGVFGLFAAEDIKSASGKTLIEKDSIIELKTTDAEGRITFKADLPMDGKYYVQEQYAPPGYVTSTEKKEFTFSYAGETRSEIKYDFTFENEPTTYVFSKTDITTGHEIPGAHLEVRDADGKLVDEWVSDEKPHIIRKLIVGKEYSMTETKPADGYVTAETIVFVVDNTANLVRVEMKDDVTKVEISKTDITTGKELPGAKLTILDKDGKIVDSWVSEDKPHCIEKLPIGEYTLREETAPDSYLKAEDVKFSVKDSGEIQKVVMKDAPNTPQETPGKPDTPKTGDESRPLLWGSLAALALLTLIGSIVIMKKNKKYR